MNVEIKTLLSREFGVVTIGKILGDLDHHTAKDIRHEIDEEIRRENPKILILDFSALTFMDSSGIGLIMGRYKLMEELSGKIIVSCCQSYIKKVLKISGVNRLAEIVEDYSCYIKEVTRIEEHSN